MSELNAKIIEVTLLRERVTDLSAKNDALERERNALAATVERTMEALADVDGALFSIAVDLADVDGALFSIAVDLANRKLFYVDREIVRLRERVSAALATDASAAQP